AVKILSPHFQHDRTFVDRFYREVEVIASLQHPRILPVYDFGQHDGTFYIVMAYEAGGTLAERLRETPGVLPLEFVDRLLGQIAEGLDYAHAKGVIHRDLKLSNILLDERGNSYIADFGLAKVLETDQHLTGSGIIGTPAYIAPELSQGAPLTSKTDLY